MHSTMTSPDNSAGLLTVSVSVRQDFSDIPSAIVKSAAMKRSIMLPVITVTAPAASSRLRKNGSWNVSLS